VRPRLVELSVADLPERWEALGFAVSQTGVCQLGAITLRLGGIGDGITAWAIDGVSSVNAIDGLPMRTPSRTGSPDVAHPNGATGIDHVVVATSDFERTAAALENAQIPLSRERDSEGFRQGFRRLGPVILELVEAKSAPAGSARFWGLVVTVRDLDGLAVMLGERLGKVRPAVQSGRRIATLRDDAGLSTKVAFMTREP
jgi:hypothetical protein